MRRLNGRAAAVSGEADAGAIVPRPWPVNRALCERGYRSGSEDGGSRQARRLHPSTSGPQRSHANVCQQERYVVDDAQGVFPAGVCLIGVWERDLR